MSTDFSFDDRVARRYNQQRAHPPEVSQQIGEYIASATSGIVLEVGIGTGRIATPVATAGTRVVGFDISPNMLSEIPPIANLLTLQADMHAIPFTANTFNAVMAVHVLHLSKNIERALQEMTRVLRPDGLFLRGDDWIDPASVVGQLRNHLRHLAVKHSPDLMPPSAMISIDERLAGLGATETREHIAAEWTMMVSAEERLQAVEQRIDAESWILPPNLFDTILQELRDFAAKQWDDLTQPQPVTRRFIVKTTHGNW